MALTTAQKVTVAEITRETYARIDSLASSLNAEQETVIGADITLWNTNRNKLKVELDGGSDGLKFKVKPLLDEIRIRTRKAFGLSAGFVAAGVFAGGISKADNEARAADTDRPTPMFTTALHQSE